MYLGFKKMKIGNTEYGVMEVRPPVPEKLLLDGGMDPYIEKRFAKEMGIVSFDDGRLRCTVMETGGRFYRIIHDGPGTPIKWEKFQPESEGIRC
jgi:hypothetical protein